MNTEHPGILIIRAADLAPELAARLEALIASLELEGLSAKVRRAERAIGRWGAELATDMAAAAQQLRGLVAATDPVVRISELLEELGATDLVGALAPRRSLALAPMVATERAALWPNLYPGPIATDGRSPRYRRRSGCWSWRS